MIFRGFR